MSQTMASTPTGLADASHVEWVRRAVAGEEAAFRWMVDSFSQHMAQVSFVICGDAVMAEDAVAAAWPIVWRKLGGLREPERLRPWLVSVAANEARHLARSRSRRAVREIAVSDVGDTAAPGRPVDEIDLANALAQLEPADRQLLALRFVAGFDSTELAQAIGISPSGTRARLARLLERVRRELSDD